MSAIDRQHRIYVAGHNGLAGSAIVRRLRRGGYENILTGERHQLDPRRQPDVEACPGIDLVSGLRDTYRWYVEHVADEAA